MDIILKSAQLFENNSTLKPENKKENVVGYSYKTVIAAAESGATSPATPIGVNLPNADWIRATHGSKSISLGNIIDAYNKAGNAERLKEFAFDEEERSEERRVGKECRYRWWADHGR